MGLTGSLLACLGLLTVSTAGAATTTASRTIYVAKSGSDTASGTSTAPLRTIGAAVSRVPENGVVMVRSGSFHENVTMVGKSGITLKAAPGATVWLDGSRTVSNWKQSGAHWVATGWTARFDSSPTLTKGAPDNTRPFWQFINPAHPMAAHPDQVWIDGVAQRQVGSASRVRAGSFYVDYSGSRLILGSSPAGHEVRASDLPKAISVRDTGTTISGINVRRYAPSVPTMGAVTVEQPDVTLANMRITDNATSGLQVGTSGVHLTNITLSRNGMIGLRANHADRMRLDRVSVIWNNRELFNETPSAGGAKITRSTGVLVKNSRFSENHGTGLWFDESTYDFEVFGSRMIGNTGNGLALEISGTAKVADNVIAGNRADGLKINDTDRVAVWNNSLVGNGRTIDIAQDGRDIGPGTGYRNASLPLTLRSERITLRNNILAKPRTSANCLLCAEDHSHRFSAARLHISTNSNVYQRSAAGRPRWLIVWSRGAGHPATFTTLTSMRSATGQESKGRRLSGAAALTAAYHPTRAVTRLVASTAYKTPAWLASAAHVKTGSRHLGAW